MAPLKAPDSDGPSAGSFQNSGETLGIEVCQAIIDTLNDAYCFNSKSEESDMFYRI